MNRLDVTLETTTVTVALDDSAPLIDRFWGVVSVRLVDELTGRPPRARITLTTTNKLLFTRVAEDGLVGLAGIPHKAFPALDTTAYPLDLTFTLPGYIGQQLIVTLPADPAFPGSFTPLVLPDLLLHRQPVVIKGRTVLANGGATTFIPGAAVRVTGIWRTSPLAIVAVPADPPNLVHLDPPVYAGREAAPGRLRRRGLTPVLGEDKFLLDPLSAGSSALHLTDRINLSAGTVLRLDADAPDRSEDILIASVQGGSTPDQEARIILDHPAAIDHRRNAVVRRALPQPLGPNNSLAADAIRGDTTVFLNSLGGLTSGQTARLSGGTSPEEYHLADQYRTTSDSKGYYRLPPISRVSQLEIEADDGIHAPKRLIISPDYEQAETVVDFVLR